MHQQSDQDTYSINRISSCKPAPASQGDAQLWCQHVFETDIVVTLCKPVQRGFRLVRLEMALVSALQKQWGEDL